MPVTHLFLAPHFDDVALSCGGTVARLAAAGDDVTVVTVFACEPSPEMPLTPYARGHLAQWGAATVADAMRIRRAEEAAAAAVLGASMHLLPLVDGVFRVDRYRSWDELRGTLAPADAAVPTEIADALIARRLVEPGTVVTGPLAIGRHVDHQAVYAAMRLLMERGVRVRGYEDYPYATDQAEYRARMMAPDLTGATPEVADIAPWVEMKVRAIGCYRSQLPSLFADTPMPEAIRRYGALVAGGAGVAERFWWLGRSVV